MEWWEGLWLNEAFATFLMYLCTDAFRPEWHTWDRFSEQREMGLSIDGLHTTRPIEFEVRSPAEAMAMADAITYEKGGSVLRMLEQYLGPETYRDAIRSYLRRHAYANTRTADLWSALEQESGQPVGRIMDTWILQGGHPVVSVAGGMISQKPFWFSPPAGPSNIGSSWLVPVLRGRSMEPASPASCSATRPRRWRPRGLPSSTRAGPAPTGRATRPRSSP